MQTKNLSGHAMSHNFILDEYLFFYTKQQKDKEHKIINQCTDSFIISRCCYSSLCIYQLNTGVETSFMYVQPLVNKGSVSCQPECRCPNKVGRRLKHNTVNVN